LVSVEKMNEYDDDEDLLQVLGITYYSNSLSYRFSFRASSSPIETGASSRFVKYHYIENKNNPKIQNQYYGMKMNSKVS
jgi:hypothetical protein